MLVLAFEMITRSGLAQEVTITLNPGWTWISYPRADTLTLAEALAPLSPMEGDVLKSQFQSVVYRNGQWVGPLNQLIPGKGLKYKSMNSNPVSFVFGAEAEEPIVIPAGAINGKFTINSNGDQVYFSQGNLQYKASTNTWRFAESQWDYVGDAGAGTVFENGIKCNNVLCSPTYDGWIDLFAWGTSGYDHGAVCYQPWSTSSTHTDYYAYGLWNANLYDQTGIADWGYNPISNGGNQENQWRTPTNNEVEYLLFTRVTTSGIRFVRAVVNGVFGVVILPDNWDSSIYGFVSYNSIGANNNENTISISDWETILEPNGAVFLPGAGRRDYQNGWVDNAGYICNYWSSTYYNDESAYCVDWYLFGAILPGAFPRGSGRSVRLVHAIQSDTSCSIEAVPNPVESGTVTGAGNYSAGQNCTVTATPNEGYSFVNWTENGVVVSEEATYSFIVTGNRNLVANFILQGGAPIGAINGLFTINAEGDQVYFSQGNLQYIGSAATPYWKFADHQWDCIGYAQIGSSQTIDRDLFGWGTSGYSHGAICYQPWSTSENYYEYFAYGSGLFNLNDQTGQADWGYNAIINGGNQESQWRTLTNDEWIYLIDTRNTDSGIRWALAIVNGCGGAILLPDNWDASTYYLNDVNGGSFYSNAISSEVWINVFEPNGAVFLPGNAGTRFGTEWADGGGYWSSTYSNGIGVYYSHIDGEHFYSSNDFGSRHYGRSVRLVRDTE